MLNNKYINLPIVTLVICMTILVYAFCQFSLFNSIGKPLLTELSINGNILANISAVTFYSNIISLIIFSVLLDKFNTIKIISAFLIFHIISTLAFSFFVNIPTLICYRIMTGMLIGVALPGCIKLCALKFQEKLAIVCGLLSLAAMGGCVLAQNPIIYLLSRTNLSGLFLILFFVGLFIYILTLLINNTAHNITYKTDIFKLWLSSINTKTTWSAAFFVSLLNIPIFLLGDLWGSLYLTQAQKFSETISASIISMLFIGYTIGAVALGWLADKTKASQIILISSSAICAILLMLLNIIPPSTIVFTLVFLCIGITTGAQPILYAFIMKTGLPSATNISLLSLVTLFLGALIQQGTGLLFQHPIYFVKSIPYYSATNYSHLILLIASLTLVSIFPAFLINFGNKKLRNNTWKLKNNVNKTLSLN